MIGSIRSREESGVMACLSTFQDKSKSIATVVANPIFLTSPIEGLPNGAEITFEVFEEFADGLRSRLADNFQYCTIDGSKFWGKLKSLTPCTSTHPGLALLRGKPTLRCVLEVFSEETTAN
jgi:hypothetical protein